MFKKFTHSTTSIILVSVLVAGTLFPLLTGRANAGPVNEAFDQVDNEIKTELAIKIVKECFKFKDEANKADYDVYHDKYWNQKWGTDETKVPIGVYSDFGKPDESAWSGNNIVDCNTKAEMDPVLKHLGFNSVREFMELVYPLNNCDENNWCKMRGDFVGKGMGTILGAGNKLANLELGPDGKIGFSDAAIYKMLIKTYQSGECKGIFTKSQEKFDRALDDHGVDAGTNEANQFKFIEPTTGNLLSDQFAVYKLADGSPVQETGLKDYFGGNDPTCIQLARKVSEYAKKTGGSSIQQAINDTKATCHTENVAGITIGTQPAYCDQPEILRPEDDPEANNIADNGESCEAKTSVITGWLFCGAMEFLSSGMDAVLGQVENMLNVDNPELTSGSNGKLHESWNVFRIMANFMLFAVAVVTIISQAMGGGN